LVGILTLRDISAHEFPDDLSRWLFLGAASLKKSVS
jgi:hypothetical protein